MKQLLLLAFLTLFCVTTTQAQERTVKKMSFEFGSGYSFGASRNGDSNTEGLFGGYFECRYNFKELPIAVGGHLGITGLNRIVQNEDKYNYRTFSALAIGDYVFGRGRRVSPFAGLGLGVSFGNFETGIFNQGFETSPAVMPRVGVRFFNHITLALDYQLMHKDYRTANCRFAFYF